MNDSTKRQINNIAGEAIAWGTRRPRLLRKLAKMRDQFAEKGQPQAADYCDSRIAFVRRETAIR